MGGLIAEGVPDGSAKELPEAGEELTLASVAQEEEAPASEAATEGQGVVNWLWDGEPRAERWLYASSREGNNLGAVGCGRPDAKVRHQGLFFPFN